METASSFKLANDEPYIFKDKAKAKSFADSKLKTADIFNKDSEQIIEDMVAKKRKRTDNLRLSPKKRIRSSIETPSTSIDSTSSKESEPPNGNNGSDIEWSDCENDEAFSSKNLSLIEQSFSS